MVADRETLRTVHQTEELSALVQLRKCTSCVTVHVHERLPFEVIVDVSAVRTKQNKREKYF